MEPTYGYRESSASRPTLKQIGIEWIDSVSFWRDASRFLPAFYAAYHLATFGICALFFARYCSLASAVWVLALASAIGTVYNTVWYHRYCTHRSFKFRSIWLARLFLWLNPVCFREESYVIPHRVHHSKSDERGDPYGPHLGWLGSYLATESQQKTNRAITRADYERLSKSLEHIGFIKNSYEQFRRFGSVENVWHYLARVVVANLFWPSVAYLIADGRGVLTWLSAVFVYALLVRDFNFRGHGGFLGEHQPRVPLNQLFYGLIGGEWHENHHAFPRSARSGLAWWQLDVPYWIIRGLAACGAVGQIHEPPKPQTCRREAPEPELTSEIKPWA